MKKKSLRAIAATTKKRPPLEASIVRACLKFLGELDDAKFYKRGGVRGRTSEPDITGCIQGQHWEIEVKREGKKPTEPQYSNLEQWSRAGAVVCWVTSKEQLRRIMRRWMDSPDDLANPLANVRKYAHNLIQ